jgi:DNA-binding NarL/FixJ family response regulator
MIDTEHQTAPHATDARPLRVVIADNHRLILAGMRAALADEEEILLVGEASTARGVVMIATRTRPDVVLLDLRMPQGDGLWALREITRTLPDTKVIVCSVRDDQAHIAQAVSEGAAGYIVKTIDPNDLAAAIRQTVEGTVFSGRAAADAQRQTDSVEMLLTERELEILRHVAEGLPNAQIARKLWVTEQTVKFHLSNVYRKLGVKNRTEASRYALRHGIISADGLDPMPEPA